MGVVHLCSQSIASGWVLKSQSLSCAKEHYVSRVLLHFHRTVVRFSLKGADTDVEQITYYTHKSPTVERHTCVSACILCVGVCRRERVCVCVCVWMCVRVCEHWETWKSKSGDAHLQQSAISMHTHTDTRAQTHKRTRVHNTHKTRTHTSTHTRTHHTHKCTHTHLYTSIYTHTNTHTHTHVNTPRTSKLNALRKRAPATASGLHTRKQIHMYTYKFTRANAHTLTYTHTHTYTYIQAQTHAMSHTHARTRNLTRRHAHT